MPPGPSLLPFDPGARQVGLDFAGCCPISLRAVPFSLRRKNISEMVVLQYALHPLPHSLCKLISAFPEEKRGVYVMKYK